MIYANILAFGFLGLSGAIYGQNTSTRMGGVLFLALCAWNVYPLFIKRHESDKSAS